MQRPEERSVQLAVRIHRTLELADDKFYVITCGKSGLARDENSHVLLKFFDPGTDRRVRETVYGRPYTIRAELTQPNGTHGIRVQNCFAFNKKNVSIPLIDERGCPLSSDIISAFKTTGSEYTAATAQLGSMFKFPDGSEVHLQCDIVLCNVGRCAADEPDCSRKTATTAVGLKGATGQRSIESTMLAATTVFVLDPSEAPSEYDGDVRHF